MGMSQSPEVRYRAARNSVEIGDHTKSELLQLYYDQKIKLTDHLWREGLEEWKTLYELYAEFLETPEQLRAYDRDVQMTTKTSYRIKYLIQKSEGYNRKNQEVPAEYKMIKEELEQDIKRLQDKIRESEDLDECEDLKSELLSAEASLSLHHGGHEEGHEEEYMEALSDELEEEAENQKEQINELESSRIAFWLTTFEKDPPKLNKKEIKKLTESYETRVSQILRGSVPWSSMYFGLGSFYGMPSTRSLFEAYGKYYAQPTEAEIKQILAKLDAGNPEWDDTNPEMFYSDLKPSIPT
jgi:hypothetical protein